MNNTIKHLSNGDFEVKTERGKARPETYMRFKGDQIINEVERPFGINFAARKGYPFGKKKSITNQPTKEAKGKRTNKASFKTAGI